MVHPYLRRRAGLRCPPPATRLQGQVQVENAQLVFSPCQEQRQFVVEDAGANGLSRDVAGLLADGPGNLFASDGHPEQLGFSLQWQSTGKDSLQLTVTSKIRGTVLHADPVWSANPNITATYQFGNTATNSGG